MILWLPERLYECLKNDEYYHQIAKKATDEVFYGNDYLSIISCYQHQDEKLWSILDYMRSKMPNKYLNEFDAVMLDKYDELNYDDMDIETKILWLYNYNNGDMAMDSKSDSINQECIKLYEDNVIANNLQVSPFIHTIYYFRQVYEMIIRYTNRQKNLRELKNFINDETKIYEEMIEKSSEESFKQIMFSKREQMYTLYLEFIGQFISEHNEVYEILWKIVDNQAFKYNYFSYYKLTFFLLWFQTYCDVRDDDKALNCLNKLVELITYGFKNKNDAVDSLNHYNKQFIDDFLVLAKFVYELVSEYMPNLDKQWDLISILQPSEYRFFKGCLTLEDQRVVKDFNVNDRFYGYKWMLAHKDYFKYLDNAQL